MRWYGRGTGRSDVAKLSSHDNFQIVGENLNRSTSTSMLTVTERIPQVYRYRCRVDLDLAADDILAKADVYPITVSGWPLCVFNSHVQVLSAAPCGQGNSLVGVLAKSTFDVQNYGFQLS